MSLEETVIKTALAHLNFSDIEHQLIAKIDMPSLVKLAQEAISKEMAHLNEVDPATGKTYGAEIEATAAQFLELGSTMVKEIQAAHAVKAASAK